LEQFVQHPHSAFIAYTKVRTDWLYFGHFAAVLLTGCISLDWNSWEVLVLINPGFYAHVVTNTAQHTVANGRYLVATPKDDKSWHVLRIKAHCKSSTQE
jgi:hypothetical protein